MWTCTSSPIPAVRCGGETDEAQETQTDGQRGDGCEAEVGGRTTDLRPEEPYRRMRFRTDQEGRGLRRFLLRGLNKVRPEWVLACIGHNAREFWISDRNNHHGLVAGVIRKTGKAIRMMRASC